MRRGATDDSNADVVLSTLRFVHQVPLICYASIPTTCSADECKQAFRRWRFRASQKRPSRRFEESILIGLPAKNSGDTIGAASPVFMQVHEHGEGGICGGAEGLGCVPGLGAPASQCGNQFRRSTRPAAMASRASKKMAER